MKVTRYDRDSDIFIQSEVDDVTKLKPDLPETARVTAIVPPGRPLIIRVPPNHKYILQERQIYNSTSELFLDRRLERDPIGISLEVHEMGCGIVALEVLDTPDGRRYYPRHFPPSAYGRSAHGASYFVYRFNGVRGLEKLAATIVSHIQSQGRQVRLLDRIPVPGFYVETPDGLLCVDCEVVRRDRCSVLEARASMRGWK